jgi:hypothetical protein
LFDEKEEWRSKYYKLAAAIHTAIKDLPHMVRTSYPESESPSQ